MSSDKKFFVAVLAVLVVTCVGCSRNKQAAVAPVATGYSAPQPVLAAPAPVAQRSSTYIK